MALVAGCRQEAPTPYEYCQEQMRIVCEKTNECAGKAANDCAQAGEGLMGVKCKHDGTWPCDAARDHASDCLEELDAQECRHIMVYLANPSSLPSCAAMACSKAAGSEGGPCRGDGSCDAGLSCHSDLCVSVPASTEPGTEGGPCRGDGTCDADLSCYSDVCVWVPTSGACGILSGSAAPDAAADWSGRGWVLTSLSIGKPFPDTLAGSFSSFFTDQFAAGKQNLVLAIVEDHRGTGTFTMKLGPAVSSGDGFRFEPDPAPVPATWKGAGFETTATTGLSLPVEVFEPPELPVGCLRIQGYFESDGTTLPAGSLSGCLSVEDARNTQIFGAGLEKILEGAPDLDTDGDGKKDAYSFQACFAAKATTMR